MPSGRGRPSNYSEKIASEILGHVASGKTLREVCREEKFPSESTVRGWVLDDREGFSARYARARNLCLEVWADEIIEISDDASNDWMARNGKDDEPSWSVNGEHIQRSKLRSDNRKWLLSKLKPHQYGDKVTVGGDEKNPIKHEHKLDEFSSRIARIASRGTATERTGDT